MRQAGTVALTVVSTVREYVTGHRTKFAIHYFATGVTNVLAFYLL